jgi:hypothetical protein
LKLVPRKWSEGYRLNGRVAHNHRLGGFVLPGHDAANVHKRSSGATDLYTTGICKGLEARRTVVSAELQHEFFLLTVTK